MTLIIHGISILSILSVIVWALLTARREPGAHSQRVAVQVVCVLLVVQMIAFVVR